MTDILSFTRERVLQLSTEKKIFLWIAAVVLFIGSAVAAVFLGWLGVLVVLAVLIFFGILFATLNDPRMGVFAVAFLLPFERVGSLDLAGITVRASQVVLLAALIGWGLAVLFRRSALVLSELVYVPMALLLAVGALSLMQAENLVRGITVLVFTAFVMTLPLLLPNVLKTPNDVRIVVRLIFLSAVLVSLFGLYQFVGDVIGLPPSVTGLRDLYTSDVFGFPRVQSTALEPLYFANYLLIPVSLSLVYFLFRKKSRGMLPVSSFQAFWLLLLTGMNVVLTLSRGGYIALAGVVGFLAILWFLDGIQLRRGLALLFVGLLAIIGAYGALLFTGKEQNIEVFVGQATEFSGGAGVEERFDTYEEAFTLIEKNSWLGVGIGNFGPAVATRSWVQPVGGWQIVNNEYLELWAELGVFGLFFFLCLIVLLVVGAIRSGFARSTSLMMQSDIGFLKLTQLGLLAALFGILIQYNTFSILYVLHIWFVIGLIVSLRRMLRTAS